MKAISEQNSGSYLSKYNSSAAKSVGIGSLKNMQAAYNNNNSRNSSNEPQDIQYIQA